MKFELDADEQKRLDEWSHRHLIEQHGGEEPYTGAIGGRVQFRITPTSIGMFLSAVCGTCERRLGLGPGRAADDETEGLYRVALTDTSDW